jgi:hypothetical protein
MARRLKRINALKAREKCTHTKSKGSKVKRIKEDENISSEPLDENHAKHEQSEKRNHREKPKVLGYFGSLRMKNASARDEKEK